MSRRTRKNKLAFYKMHSLGNDFMVIDGVSHGFKPEPEAIARWGDRHRGIGFDQFLIIAPPTHPDADFDYLIYNADGSQAQQCGNGTRCVAMLVSNLRLMPKQKLVWHSAAGLFQTERVGDQFSTSMTVPVLEPNSIPLNLEVLTQLDTHRYRLTDADDAFEFTAVSMGNPHAVHFVDDVFQLDVNALGARLTDHQAFPERANIGFCQVVDRQFVHLRVYERGTGETQACGSGACAAVVAAQLGSLVDQRVKVSLPGGKLRISWAGADAPVMMSGPAALTYKGELSP